MTRLEDRTGRPSTPYSSPSSRSDQLSLAATAKTTYVAPTSASSEHSPTTVTVCDELTPPFQTRVTRSCTTLNVVFDVPRRRERVTDPWNTMPDVRVLDGTSSNRGSHVVTVVDVVTANDATKTIAKLTTIRGRPNIIPKLGANPSPKVTTPSIRAK